MHGNAGLVVRIITTFLSMSGFGYTTHEKLFYAIAWTPKATVQAALSGENPSGDPSCAAQASGDAGELGGPVA